MITVLLIAVPTGLLGTFTLLDAQSGTTKESYPIVITLDKDVYHPAERINITVKNVSNKTLRFTSTAYGLQYQRKTIFGWEYYKEDFSGAITPELRPGETAQVRGRLSTGSHHFGTFKPFPPGRYRVGHQGYDCWAEFDVA